MASCTTCLYQVNGDCVAPDGPGVSDLRGEPPCEGLRYVERWLDTGEWDDEL